MLYLGTVFLDCGWYVARVLTVPDVVGHESCGCGMSARVDEIRFRDPAELDHPLKSAIIKKAAAGLKTEEEWVAAGGFPDTLKKEFGYGD